jgi:lipoate-protein ligase A
MSLPENWKLVVLPMVDADGATQMGLDLALLDHAHDAPGTIWLRTYTWSRPTISLGYFQAWHEFPAAMRAPWSDHAVVRRPSGGGAIVHDGDVTYAIVVPSGHPWTNRPRSLYRAVHDALAHLLTEDGAEARRRRPQDDDDASEKPVRTGLVGGGKAVSPFLCFEDGDADDLVLDGAKIVGGAQRRRAWATLQHGSIRWTKPAKGPDSKAPGLMELRPHFREPSKVLWAAGLWRRLGQFWSLEVQAESFPAEVMLAAHAWSRRLREEEWLNKR